MPKARARTTDADRRQTPDPAVENAPAADTQDGVARLAVTLQELQTRHDEFLRRFLHLIEERRVLDQALLAERFKTAGLQRDLRAFQHQHHVAQTELTEIRAQNDHHKQLSVDLRDQLGEMRALSQRLQQALEETRAQRNQQVQMNKDLQQELYEIRHSRTWELSQKYWNLSRRLRGR